MAEKHLYTNCRSLPLEVRKAKPLCTVKQAAKESHRSFIRNIHDKNLLMENLQDSITPEAFEHGLFGTNLVTAIIARKLKTYVQCLQHIPRVCRVGKAQWEEGWKDPQRTIRGPSFLKKHKGNTLNRRKKVLKKRRLPNPTTSWVPSKKSRGGTSKIENGTWSSAVEAH